ncbi:melatonin receptor type 1A-like [Ptychodera flava]|uniref:melatonin receptor type 1A-like n=1 Tax=Ptychodera flava TaxID=63121 RepID=UPI00396A0C4A
MNNTTTGNVVQLPMPAIWTTQVSSTIELAFAVITLLGNFVFVGAVIFKKKLQTLGNAFLVNLSFTDIFSALFVSTFSSDSQLRRGWHLGYTMCVTHLTFHPIAIGASLYSTACIAMNRYFFIVHRNYYDRITTKLTLTLGVLFTWALPTAIHGYGIQRNALYHPSIFRCRADVSELEFAVTLYFPSVVTVVFYALIYTYIRKSRKRVQAYPGQSTSSANKGPNQQEIRMLKVLIAIFLLVLLGYLPYMFILNIYIAMGKLPPLDALILAYPSRNLAGALNPILYGCSNKNFQIAYKELLKGKLFRGKADKSAVAPLTNARQDRPVPTVSSQTTDSKMKSVTPATTSAASASLSANMTQTDGNNSVVIDVEHLERSSTI